MPRRLRIQLAGMPQHLVQRGVNREPCFFADEDYHCYLHWLKEAARDWRCTIHAYVLMTNHVHLLLTPASPQGPAKLMQSVGRRYVQYVNEPKGSASIDILRSSNATPPTHQTRRNAPAPFCNGASTDFRSELDEEAHAGKARQTGGQGESEARAGRSNGFWVLTWSA